MDEQKLMKKYERTRSKVNILLEYLKASAPKPLNKEEVKLLKSFEDLTFKLGEVQKRRDVIKLLDKWYEEERRLTYEQFIKLKEII